MQAWLAARGPDAGVTAADLLRDVLDGDAEQAGEAERAAARAWLDRLEQLGLFKQLDSLSQQACFVPPVESPLMSRPAPWVGSTRLLATICSLRLEYAREARDEAEIVRSLRHLLAVEGAVTSEISIIARLTGLAVRAQGLKAVAAMIHDDELSASLAAQLGRVMDDHEPLPLVLTVEAERLIALDTVAHTGQAVEGLVAAAGGEDGLTRESQAKAIRMIEAYMDGLRDYATGDAAKREAGAAAMERIVKECERAGDSPHAMLVSMVLPGPNVVHSARRLEAQTAGVRTMLAIEQFEHDHNAPPASLDDLVPEYLAAVPLDPFAAGAPLGYRTLDAQDDDHGGSYLLYTVGADGEDNGGKIAPRSMMNAFTHNGQGFDFVFTNPQWE